MCKLFIGKNAYEGKWGAGGGFGSGENFGSGMTSMKERWKKKR